MTDSTGARSRYVGRLSVPVHAPGSPSAQTCGLGSCIAGQQGVMNVQHDCRSGRLNIHYDMRVSTAGLLRAMLCDRAAACAPPIQTEPQCRLEDEFLPELSVVHETKGRVRLRLGIAAACHCARVASRLADLPGVVSALASPTGTSVVVRFAPELTTVGSLLDAVGTMDAAGSGLSVQGLEPGRSRDSSRRQLIKMGCTAAVFCAAVTGVVPVSVALAGVSLTAIPSFRRAIESLGQKRVNVDVLDATAIAICIWQLDPVSAGAITTLLAIGDVILDRTQQRARTAISKLIQLDDGEAFILEDPENPPRRVHPRELRAGMQIVVYPGTRIPVDGTVKSGAITVDEKAITGESLPRERLAGGQVLAAGVAVHGQAVVEVTRAGSDTTAARIVQILQGVGMKPMTLQKNAERSADRLVLPTFAIAGAAYALSGIVQRVVCVLITDFGTGVRIAVPTTALASMTLGARKGLLIKGAQSLERLNEVDTIIFDKTGTLTRGVPEVTEVVKLGELSEQQIVGFAAAAETNQAHPLADAIRRHAQAIGAPAWHAEHGSESYRIGLGLETCVSGRRVCVGNPRLMRQLGIDTHAAERAKNALAERGVSSVLVAVDDKLEGVIGIADEPRGESPEVIRVLRDNGRRKIMLLSGDARAPAEAVARHCGIDELVAEVLPHDKAEVVKSLKAAGRKVAMVGDGINDAPALALADVGVSLHGATDVARETADVVLLEGGLERLPELFNLSRDAMRRVRTVLGIVLVPNAAAIVVGALGLINPVVAAILNNGSTVAAALYAAAPLLRRQNRSRGRSAG